MKVKKAMLLCLALLFIISLGFSAVSAADSNDNFNMESDQNLVLSDSLNNLDVDSSILDESQGDNYVDSDSLGIDDLTDNSDNNLDDSDSLGIDDLTGNSDNNLESNSKENLKSNALGDDTNTIYVSPNGNDDNDGLSRETPVRDFSKAASLADEGFTIYLLPGVYNQDKNTQLSKNLYFVGENGAIINRTAKLAVFTYTSDNIKTVSFKNIVFISESSDATNPILSMAGHANLVCDNCSFTNIIATRNGVVRYMGNSTGSITNCRFVDLYGTSNGASSYLYILGEAKVNVNNCIFANISNDFLRVVVYVNNDLANLSLNNSHFYGISGNANAIVENRGTMIIDNCRFNDNALSGNSPEGIIWASEKINNNSKTYINSSSFYNNSIDTTVVINRSIIQAKSSVTVEYSSFINNDVDFIINNDNNTEIIANLNWWGRNDNPKDLVSDGVTIENWFVMNVDFETNDLIAGEEYPISISIGQITNLEGESYYLDEGITGAEIVLSSQNGNFKVNSGIIVNGIPIGGGILADGGKIAKVYTKNGFVSLIYAPATDGSEVISIKSGYQEFIYNIELAEAIVYNEYYVSKSGSDENDGLTNRTAFKTIAHALEVAKSLKANAKIHISSGNYEENGLTIGSYGSGMESPHFAFIGYGNVVIDGKGQSASIFNIRNGSVSFKNIRFTNVNSATINGGALNIASDDGSTDLDPIFVNLTVNNCTFDNLFIGGDGGAIRYDYVSGKININNTKFLNIISNTGAVYIYESEPVNLKITNSLFKDNIAENAGALNVKASNISIGNCDFVNNSAKDTGGAIIFLSSNAIVENSTIINCSSKNQASAILVDGYDYNTVTIRNSIIENNSRIAENALGQNGGISGNGLGDGNDDGQNGGISGNGLGDGNDDEEDNNYAIYVYGGKLDISYSSIVNNFSLATSKDEDGWVEGVAIANNNWWGTNDPTEVINGSRITIDKWLILNVHLNNTGVLKVGNSVNVTIDFNHVMTSSGEIEELAGGKISREFAIRMNATAGRIYPYYIVTRDRIANSIFTVEDGGASLDIRTENALVHIDFIVNNYYGVIYVSNNGNDDWNGSIESPVKTYEKALSLAMEEGGSHHIFFLEGTYEFCDVNVDETYLTIEGEGIDKSILDGAFFTGGMISNYNSTLIIKNITLTNAANTVASGGAITNMGDLTLDTVKISNSIVKNGNGGAIYSVGNLNIKNSTFENNLVDNGAYGGSGGAIYCDGYYTNLEYPPSINITDSQFISNAAKGSTFGGGAIYMQYVDGFKSIKNTQFIDNQALYGGAIFLQNSIGNFNMDNVSFIGNKATGSSSSNPYYGGGALNLIGTTDGSVGNITITNSLFINNSAKNTRGGGAILDRNVDLNISNSIILDNSDTSMNVQIYKDTTVYYPNGGKVILEDNWWGVNDLRNLSTLASNATINRWVVMDLSAEINEEIDDGNQYIVKLSLDKYNDCTLIEDNPNYEKYADYPFERQFKLTSNEGSFNPESAILENNRGESIFQSKLKDNKITGTIDNQSLEFNTIDLYVATVIELEIESTNITTRFTDLNISLKDNESNLINCTVILSVNGKEEEISLEDGKAAVEIKDLDAGINNITVSFKGHEKYLESENSCLIEVRITNVNLDMVVDDIVAGESSNVKVFLFDESGNPLNATVKLSVNSKDYEIEVKDGKGSVDIDPINEIGNYTVLASLESEEYEGNTSCESTLTVYGPGNVTVKHTDAGDALDIQAAIDAANPGDTIQLGSYDYANVSDVNITKDLSIVGNEKTTVSSKGDKGPIFNIVSKDENGPEEVNVSGIDFKLNNGDIVFKAFAQNDTENNLSIDTQAISITGNTFETLNDSIVAESINILYLESERGVLVPTNEIIISDNTISAGINPLKFEVNSVVSGADANITNMNITPERNATVIVFENMNTTAVSQADGGKTGEYFVWRLTDADGKPLANTPMEIGFNGVVYTYEKDGIITDDDGYAKLQINLGYKGVYTFAICFLGNDQYNASFVVAKITVDTQKGSLTVPSKSYAASAKTKTLTASFKSAKGNPIADKWISFTVNGKTYKAKTNSNGVASVNVSINKKGTYSFTAKYAGDSTYTAISKTAKLTIK